VHKKSYGVWHLFADMLDNGVNLFLLHVNPHADDYQILYVGECSDKIYLIFYAIGKFCALSEFGKSAYRFWQFF